jgi:hypothetical protein
MVIFIPYYVIELKSIKHSISIHRLPAFSLTPTQIILYYLQENLVINLKKWENSIFAFFIHTIALVFLLGESFSINKIFERMVVESSIRFNFDYFPRLTIYSFIGLGIMLMTFSNYYLLSNLILKTIYNFKLNNQKIILSFFVFLLSIILLLILGSFRLEVKLTFVLLLFFIAFIQFLIKTWNEYALFHFFFH